MDLNVMMKYKRKRDCWVCPVCENENTTDTGKCYLCGHVGSGNEAFLKAWSAEDEARERAEKMRNDLRTEQSTQNKKPPVKPITPRRETKIFEDDVGYVPPKEKKSHKGLVIFIVLLVVLAIVAVVLWSVYSNYEKMYSEGIRLYNIGKYEDALGKFESLPYDYKNTAEKIKDTKYNMACEYMNEGDIQSARSIFTELGDYSDSAQMLNECSYAEACLLYETGQYADAKVAFENLSGYSDSDKMMDECDYQQGLEYYNDGDYVLAMGIFNSISSYRDSKTKFSNCERALVRENSSKNRYAVSKDMIGNWQDKDGNYVKYEYKYIDGVEGTEMTSSMSYDNANKYMVENGIHYHDNGNSWKKQWIFEYISYNSAYVYNYAEGKTYVFEK